jgi:putative protease
MAAGSEASGEETAHLPLHASTQCAIRTPEKAKLYESLGFTRLVLEREMSLDEIRKIRSAVDCELEFFVHGALCVCYSGQCYMSEYITSRSANRGECIQACRSLYDLEDASGKVLVRNKALLSLKDYNLLHRLEDLAEAGIDSFKIEGRLKNISYVRNVTRAYSLTLDDLVARHPDKYRRASFGHVRGGFSPDIEKTFNRRYTELFIDGKRGRWSSMDAPKSIGEEIGTVAGIRMENGPRRGHSEGRSGEKMQSMSIRVALKNPSYTLHNGDGFAFISGDEIVGFRGDVCEDHDIHCKAVHGLKVGTKLFRNVDNAFEHELDSNLPSRLIDVEVAMNFDGKSLNVSAQSEDGRKVALNMNNDFEPAKDQERMAGIFRSQITKVSGIYSFSLSSIEATTDPAISRQQATGATQQATGAKIAARQDMPHPALPFMPVSAINAIRRDIAAKLDKMPCKAIPLGKGRSIDKASMNMPKSLTYKENVANHIAREIYESLGAESVEPAFELSHRQDAELMRTKYCIRYELGLCPKHQHAAPTGPLFLVNNGSRYALGFDCSACEMTVSAASKKQQ